MAGLKERYQVMHGPPNVADLMTEQVQSAERSSHLKIPRPRAMPMKASGSNSPATMSAFLTMGEVVGERRGTVWYASCMYRSPGTS